MKIRSIVVFFFLMQVLMAGAQSQIKEGSLHTQVTEDLHYYLYYPPDYYPGKEERFPLLLFLHGGGESGDDLEAIQKLGPPKMLVEGKQFPFLVLAPQNPHKKQWWNTRAVKQLLDSVIRNNNVDPTRIYLSGLSRGGSAAWEMVVQYPDTFAALAVMCGMTPVPYASWIDKELPIWVFHGTKDESIPFSESKNMVEALQKLGHNVRFTVYKGLGHNVWERAYAMDELYDWMVFQKRKNKPKN